MQFSQFNTQFSTQSRDTLKNILPSLSFLNALTLRALTLPALETAHVFLLL